MDKNLEKVIELIRRKWLARMDADEEEEPHKKKGGNTRLPYGLCQSVGIDTTGMTPKEAWEAYYGKTGVEAEEAYEEHFPKENKSENKNSEKPKDKFDKVTDENFEDAKKHYEELKKDVRGLFPDNKEYRMFSNGAKIGNVGMWFSDDEKADAFIEKAEEYENLSRKLTAHFLGTEANHVKYTKQSASREEKLRACEDRNRNDKTETAVILGSDGKILIDKSDGESGQVSFTAEQSAQMKDATLTHNHPNNSPFSQADIETAYRTGLREMRATTKNGAYVLRRKFEIGWQVPENYEFFGFDYMLADDNYKREVVDEIYEKTGDAKKCNDMIWEFNKQWLKEHAADYGWEYSEEAL